MMTLDSAAYAQLKHIKGELAHILLEIAGDEEYQTLQYVDIIRGIQALAKQVLDSLHIDYSNDEQIYGMVAILHQISAVINYYEKDVPQEAIDDTKQALIYELELDDDIYKLFGPLFLHLFTEITIQIGRNLANHQNLIRESNES